MDDFIAFCAVLMFTACLFTVAAALAGTVAILALLGLLISFPVFMQSFVDAWEAERKGEDSNPSRESDQRG